jgi:cytoskeletal protein RodZ
LPVNAPHAATSRPQANRKIRQALIILLGLCFVLLLPGCGDEDKSGQSAEQNGGQTSNLPDGQEAGQSAGQTTDAASDSEQGAQPGLQKDAKADLQIRVGALDLPMPAPQGFERVKPDQLLYSKVTLKAGETLLCVFARPIKTAESLAPVTESASTASASQASEPASGQGSEPASQNGSTTASSSGQSTTPSAAPTGETPDSAKFDGPPEAFDLLLVTTLDKWVFSHLSLEGFEKIKSPWQKNSVVCNQDTLNYFTQAALSRLADTSEYTYNLGMTGADRQQISFARIIKSSDADGQSKYVCAMNSLLYRNGKILGLSCRVRIWNLAEIGPVIEGYMAYLHSLQALDEQLSEQEISRQTLRRKTTIAANDAG